MNHPPSRSSFVQGFRPWISILSLCTAALGATAFGAAGLGGCSALPDAENAQTQHFPPWKGPMKELYPNQIDPAALGLGAPSKPSKADVALVARATQSDVIGRARIQTVTVGRRMGVETYILGIQFATPRLVQPATQQSTFELEVTPEDECYGMVKAFDNRLQGKTFVAAIKRFGGQDDQVDTHFFLYPDSNDVATVISESVALGEIK